MVGTTAALAGGVALTSDRAPSYNDVVPHDRRRGRRWGSRDLGVGASVRVAELTVAVTGPAATARVVAPLGFELTSGEDGGFRRLAADVPARGVRKAAAARTVVEFSYGVLVTPFNDPSRLPSPVVPIGTEVTLCDAPLGQACTDGRLFRTTEEAVISRRCLTGLFFGSGRCSGRVAAVATEPGAAGNGLSTATTRFTFPFPGGGEERVQVVADQSSGGADPGKVVTPADTDLAVRALLDEVRPSLRGDELLVGHRVNERQVKPDGSETIGIEALTVNRAELLRRARPGLLSTAPPGHVLLESSLTATARGPVTDRAAATVDVRVLTAPIDEARIAGLAALTTEPTARTRLREHGIELVRVTRRLRLLPHLPRSEQITVRFAQR